MAVKVIGQLKQSGQFKTSELIPPFSVPFTLSRTITYPDASGEGDADENFGEIVAVSGIYTAIASPYSDTEDTIDISSTGRVRIFNTTTGELIHTLNQPVAPVTSSRFGSGISISGDRIAVGGRYGSSTLDSVYIFSLVTGELLQTIINPNISTESPNDMFGYGAGLSFDGDLVLIGAYSEDNNTSNVNDNRGAAYLFNATTGELITQIVSPYPGTNYRFGISVKLSGDRAIISDRANSNGGRLYVYDNMLTNPTFSFIISNPNPDGSNANDNMSYFDFSNDYIVSCALGEDTTATNNGMVYVFNTTGTLLRSIANPNTTGFPANSFTRKPVIIDNLLFAGSLLDTASGVVTGLAYVFNLNTGDLLQTIEPPVALSGGQFGVHMDSDGKALVIGEPGKERAHIYK